MPNTKSLNHKLHNDPLQGAPGHTQAGESIGEKPGKSGQGFKSSKGAPAKGEDDASDSHGTSKFDEAMKSLSSALGAENMNKVRELIRTNAKDAEAKIQGIIKSAKDSLPDDFSLADFTPTKRQLTRAAGVAGGIGLLVLLREYFTGDSVTPPKAASRAPAKANVIKKAAKGSPAVAVKAKAKAKKPVIKAAVKKSSAKQAKGKRSK